MAEFIKIENLLVNNDFLKKFERNRNIIFKKIYSDKNEKIYAVIELLKSGFLNMNELVFLDIETEKFCVYNIRKDTIIRLLNKSVLENIVFKNYN